MTKEGRGEASPIGLDDIVSVEELVARHPGILTRTGLKWQIRHRHENGLAPAVVTMGKRLLLSRSRYEAWLGKRAGASS